MTMPTDPFGFGYDQGAGGSTLAYTKLQSDKRLTSQP